MSEFNLSLLTSEISDLNTFLQQRAIQQVNTTLSVRNWLIGLYVVEYEQNGSDRAKYAKAIDVLAGMLKNAGIRGLDARSIRTCRAFYLAYPQIWGTVSAKLQITDNESLTNWGTTSTIFANSLTPNSLTA